MSIPLNIKRLATSQVANHPLGGKGKSQGNKEGKNREKREGKYIHILAWTL